MDFREEFNEFINLIQTNAPKLEIKKRYIVMVKKYHPDTASDDHKKLYNDYMILLNKVYTADKKKFLLKPEFPKEDIKNVVYSFKSGKNGITKTFTNYYEYLVWLGQNYYQESFSELEHSRNLFNDEINYKIMEKLYQASLVLNKVIKESKDKSKITIATGILEDVYRMNANLAKGLSKTASTEISKI